MYTCLGGEKGVGKGEEKVEKRWRLFIFSPNVVLREPNVWKVIVC